ncbi:MAG: AAA family ATPase [Alphaproteobacteria bacterium]|nr:AAA family ATPase [Alphaproteobacteria bacterium]MBU2042201.1 AAA family ATPase [Alphaproteobacteria bacterium]MBU2125615.1 AAA family ATPase [Alphaproteobacteria bacterium]MBU2208392.1 AAA family ATPase [Alphaproteobacteria bacterium]MBU2290355.1 AAA family ATPase [Alphaproteobacteria bacterium]
MKLQSVRLQWFRGAAADATLQLDGKSAVVYGPNGAGKSSYVDGLEALLSGGRVSHLSHEYAGRYQENGLVNTARPPGQSTKVVATLTDGSTEELTWTSGAPARARTGPTAMGWEYARTALRQEDLARFISATKGEKYSAVVPLLGLARLEAMADNLHKLVAAVERIGDLQKLRGQVQQAEARRADVFGEATREQLLARLEELRKTYVPAAPIESSLKTLTDVLAAINTQSASSSADQRRAAAVAEIGSSDLGARLAKVEESSAKVAEVAAPLIKERLEVLSAADRFASADETLNGSMSCPACGLSIDAEDFKGHIAKEQQRLEQAQKVYEDHRGAIAEVCDEVGRLRLVANKEDLSAWRAGLTPEPEAGAAYLIGITVADLRTTCGASDIADLKAKVEPLVARAAEDAKDLPQEVQTLIKDQQDADVLFGSYKANALRAAIRRGEALINLVKALEKEVREEMADRARQTFESISGDIQRYWGILQPNEAVSDLRLVIPEGNDKAIDVALRFHGKALHSPRLTLSEGRRNALGLCIFLAMANQAGEADQPIILDDVVISFDREHRNRVAPLLQQEFDSRQVVLLTHDREWYFELERMLPTWRFRKLLAFASPGAGMAFADQALDWEKAKAKVGSDPEDALSNVRRIMDVALGQIGERIGLAVPFLRGAANDTRTSGQFILALHKAVPHSFRIKQDGNYVSHDAAAAAVAKVKPQLEAWANRGTHTFNGTDAEALDLIESCEAVLGLFQCDHCNSQVGTRRGNAGAECSCGKLRWKPE